MLTHIALKTFLKGQHCSEDSKHHPEGKKHRLNVTLQSIQETQVDGHILIKKNILVLVK